MIKLIEVIGCCALLANVVFAQSPSFWTYMNPVIPGDHPDCTVTKIGNDFYTTGSSFNPTPRYSQTEPSGTVETLGATSHQWFREAMFQFAGSNVSRLPEDHHELSAMCAPRALLVTANPDYTWHEVLTRVSSRAL